MTPARIRAEEGFGDENYQRLNELIYQARPADYFLQRIANALVVGSDPEARDNALKAGAGIGKLRIHADEPHSPSFWGSADERDTRAKHFLTAEAAVLFHHASETLLRLYLAHEAMTACPWLTMSQTRSPALFKRQVAQRFVDEPHHSEASLRGVGRVFHLAPGPEHVKPSPPTEVWDASVKSVEDHLRYFANRFLKKAPLYNAAKHGLAFLQSEADIQIREAELTSSGPVIHTLEERTEGERNYWFLVTHGVQTDQFLALTYRIVDLIDSLWNAARYRYVTKTGGINMRLWDKSTLTPLLEVDDGHFHLDEWVEPLVYYVPDVPDAQ